MFYQQRTFVWLCLAIVICTLPLFAQPDYSTSNFPKSGFTYTMYSCDTTGIDTLTGGANRIWSYPTIKPTATFTTNRYTDPKLTPYSSQYPGASLVRVTDSTYEYFGIPVAPTIQRLGVIRIDKSLQENLLADPYELGPVPIKYQGYIRDGYRGSVVSTLPPSTGTRSGVGEVYYSGYGSLRLGLNLPIQNIMRMVFVETTADTVKGVQTTVTTTKRTAYQFIHRDSIQPTLQIIYITQNVTIDGHPVQRVTRKIVETSGVRGSQTNVSEDTKYFGLQITPNPAGDVSRIMFSTPLDETVHITVTDLIGNTVYSATQVVQAGVRFVTELPTHTLAQGVYSVHISTQSKTTSAPLIVVR